MNDEIYEEFKGLKSLDTRVKKFTDRIINTLEQKNGVLTDYDLNLLDLLIMQLIIYYKSVDEVSDTEKLIHEDNYKRASKQPALQVLQKTHDQILHILDKLGVSPLAYAKIKKLNSGNTDDNTQELLDELTS